MNSSNYALAVNNYTTRHLNWASVLESPKRPRDSSQWNCKVNRIAPLCVMVAGVIHVALAVAGVAEAFLRILPEMLYVAMTTRSIKSVANRATIHLGNINTSLQLAMTGISRSTVYPVALLLVYLYYHNMEKMNAQKSTNPIVREVIMSGWAVRESRNAAEYPSSLRKVS